MINTMFLGINIFLLIIIWKKVLKPSILDNYRDKLFDLREEVRTYYLSNGISLDNRTYIQLRNLINSHLRFTEEMSLIKCAFFISQLEKNKDLKNYIHSVIEKEFITDNKELSLFIESVRKKAIDILLEYMVISSPAIIILLILAVIGSIPGFIMQTLSLKIKAELKYITDEIKVTLAKIVVKIIPRKDYVEEVSYEIDLLQRASISD